MKKLFIALTFVYSAQGVAKINCDIDIPKIEKEVRVTKLFFGSHTDIGLLRLRYSKCSRGRAGDYATAKCYNAGYKNCRVIDDYSGHSQAALNHCTATVEGKKPGSTRKINRAVCTKINQCQVKLLNDDTTTENDLNGLNILRDFYCNSPSPREESDYDSGSSSSSSSDYYTSDLNRP